MNNNNFLDNNQDNFLKIPTLLNRFNNTETNIIKDNNKEYIEFKGYVSLSKEDRICPHCHGRMCYNDKYSITIKHVPFGSQKTYLKIDRIQLICYDCNITKMQDLPFKANDHMITNTLHDYIVSLLATGKFTNVSIANIVGVNRNIIKEIDKKRLVNKYTINGEGKTLIKPERQAQFLAIDEFKLHDGYKYATHIIDLETGSILWIAEGKKKHVVYDFIEHVGNEWMKNVKAVACDMNSDFEEAFKEKCPTLDIVYDYFHIVKNFNEKVIANIRKDEQKRLEDLGDIEGAKKLKKRKYLLTSNTSTLEKKDKEVQEQKVIEKGNTLFKKQEITRKGLYYDRYNSLINNNELFLIIALIKELILKAFSCNNEEKMVEALFDIMELCEANGNKHLLWFEKLIYNHFDGIITHSKYKISTGKIEGINNKIKTLRRQAYGYPDDEYFFLKLLDVSRN